MVNRLLGKVVKGDIIQFAEACDMGITVVVTNNDTNNYPGMNSGYTIGFVLNRDPNSAIIVLFSYSLKEVYLLCKSGAWDDSFKTI